jgi:hypothetical protein
LAIKESIVEGMRLTHTTHGDGRIQSIVDRVSPKTKAIESYATVLFSSVHGKVSWSSLLTHGKGLERVTDTSLTLLVAVNDIETGPNWFLANDYGDLSDIIVDIERLSTKHSAITPINSTESIASQITTLGKNLEKADLSPEGDPINILKIVTDWSAERLAKQSESHTRSVAAKSADLSDWLNLMDKRQLWQAKLYPGLPEQIRSGTERVLVSVAGLISCGHEVEMPEAARILTEALENRIENLHGKKFRIAQSRLDAQISKIGVN